jgi:hypothetical protein
MAACISPTSYGAVADDGKPDTAAFQQAIDVAVAKHADVCIPDGVWNIDRTPSIASLVISAGPLVVRGNGAKSVLRLTGKGEKRDWRLLQIRGPAHDVTLRDFAVDGLEATDTEEQTHLVELAADAHAVTITKMLFGPMRRPDQKVGEGIGGDCIRLLGEKGHEIDGVTITSSTFTDCDRSAVELQRGVRHVQLADLTITGVGDTPIDSEPTGAGTIEDVEMTRLHITRTMDAQGSWAITIGGVGADVAKRIKVTDSELVGGGIEMLNVADITISHNTISHGPGGAATVVVRRRGDRVKIEKNTITREGDGVLAAPVIQLSHNNGEIPHDVQVVGNTLRQGTSSTVVLIESVSDVVLRDNTIEYTGTDSRAVAIDVNSIAADVDGLRVEANRVTGVKSILHLAPRKRKIGKIVIAKNRSSTAVRAIHCDGAPQAFEGVDVDDNDFGKAETACAAEVVHVPVHAAHVHRDK